MVPRIYDPSEIGRGRTPGKAMVGLRVVTDIGEGISLRHAMVRGLLQLVEIPTGLGFFAAVSNPRQQRLGDLAAGTIVIARMWLWQAWVAGKALDDSPADRAFYEGKLAACRYFFRYQLPHALTQLELVAALDTTCLHLTPEQFIGS